MAGGGGGGRGEGQWRQWPMLTTFYLGCKMEKSKIKS